MRIDARTPGFSGRWKVWHCRLCRQLKTVVYVDDALNVWGEYVTRPDGKFLITNNGLSIVEHHADKIVIRSGIRLVLIDPPEDQGDEVLDRLLEMVAK